MGNSIQGPFRQYTPSSVPVDLLSSLTSSVSSCPPTCPPCQFLLPSDPEYLANRVTFNKDITGFPSLMIVPSCPEHVSRLLPVLNEFAKASSSFPLTVAGGRHSHLCMEDDSIMLDMRRFKSILVDVEGQSVECGAGVKIGELDSELSRHQLAVPVGTNVDTGIAGLSLGGGFGYLSRRYGLTVDNILSVTVALADGRIVTATRDNEYSDLLWAHQGGGGNFGVVLSWTYRTYSRGDTVHGFNLYWFRKKTIFGFPGIESFLQKWSSYVANNSNETYTSLIFMCGGPIIAGYAYIGDDVEEGKKHIDEWNGFAAPTYSDIGVGPYSNSPKSLQQMAEKVQFTSYFYESGVLLRDLTMDTLRVLLRRTESPRPNRDSVIIVFQMGGRVCEVKPTETAFAARNTLFWVLVLSKWKRESVDDRRECREWVLSTVRDLRPWSAGSYNTLGAAEAADVSDEGKESDDTEFRDVGGEILPTNERFFGTNLQRLRKIKTKFDQNNLFRKNKNIRPMGWRIPTKIGNVNTAKAENGKYDINSNGSNGINGNHSNGEDI